MNSSHAHQDLTLPAVVSQAMEVFASRPGAFQLRLPDRAVIARLYRQASGQMDEKYSRQPNHGSIPVGSTGFNKQWSIKSLCLFICNRQSVGPGGLQGVTQMRSTRNDRFKILITQASRPFAIARQCLWTVPGRELGR